MLSTLITRPIANPQRTTLAHLQDTDELTATIEPPAAGQELPTRTANPRRTILTDRLPTPELL